MLVMTSMTEYGKLAKIKKSKQIKTHQSIMKLKYALIALLTVSFFGCDDNTAGLGLGLFPGGDQGIKGQLSTFDVTTESVLAGSIYAKTNIGYVGKFTDPTFGTYKAGFMAGLNCPEGLTFPAVYTVTQSSNGNPSKATGVMVGDESEDNKDVTFIKDSNGKIIGNIHTVEVYMLYNGYFGDSLTACRLSLYELNKKLSTPDAYLTSIDPTSYCNKSTGLLGTKAYTAVDMSIKDSLRNSSSYSPNIRVNLKSQIAERVGGTILKASRDYGKDLYKHFGDSFKGLYVESDYGDGTILYVNQVQMNVVYKCYATDSITGLKLKKKVKEEGDLTYKDSTYYTYRTFLSTREVIQANSLENDENAINDLINNSLNCTYLKTPSGIFTEATLPIDKIESKLLGDTLNAVKLAFSNYNQDSDKKFGMSIPTNVMLIRKQIKDSFFKKNQLHDGISSFLTANSSNQYTFSNITKLINACIAEKNKAIQDLEKGPITITRDDNTTVTVTNLEDWKKESGWDKVLLIPVLLTYDSTTSTNSNIISIQHDLKPGYVRLKGGKKNDQSFNNIKMEVTSTHFDR